MSPDMFSGATAVHAFVVIKHSADLGASQGKYNL